MYSGGRYFRGQAAKEVQITMCERVMKVLLHLEKRLRVTPIRQVCLCRFQRPSPIQASWPAQCQYPPPHAPNGWREACLYPCHSPLLYLFLYSRPCVARQVGPPPSVSLV